MGDRPGPLRRPGLPRGTDMAVTAKTSRKSAKKALKKAARKSEAKAKKKAVA